MKSTQVTIKDIARHLGISPSTVSRALKDHPDISQDTKDLVVALAKELKYQPNSVALSLKQSKTFTIGVIVPELVHFFFSTVISGIDSIAYSSGYNVIIAQSNESYEREVKDTQALFNSRVDGILVSISRETKNFDHFKELHEYGVPIVLFDRGCDDINVSQVIVDDYQGAFNATTHLIEQGCKKIVHMAGPQNLAISRDRYRGYIDALKAHSMEVDDRYIINCDLGVEEEAFDLVNDFLASGLKPDGLFAHNDPAASGAILAFKKYGITIPNDVMVIGFSNWQFCKVMTPTLSSVEQPGYEIGQKAASLLIKEIEANENEVVTPEKIVLNTKLVVRESTQKPRT